MKKMPSILMLILLTAFLHAQDKQDSKQNISPKPVFSGYTALGYDFSKNDKETQFNFNPILLVPIGNKVLIESEFEIENVRTKVGDGDWESETEKGFEFLQVDYFAHKNLAVVAGRFLRPYGIYIERYHPPWIKNLRVSPFSFDLVDEMGNGLMLRGGATVSKNVNLNYAGYYTFKTVGEENKISGWFESMKSFGGRVSVFVPSFAFELGVSYNQMYETDEPSKAFCLDLTKQFKEQFIDIRGEYSNVNDMGSAYWIEAAHSLIWVPVLEPFFERSQIVARWEQFLPKDESTDNPKMSRPFFGYNFYITHELKLSFAYGIAISGDENTGIGDLGISWRF